MRKLVKIGLLVPVVALMTLGVAFAEESAEQGTLNQELNQELNSGSDRQEGTQGESATARNTDGTAPALDSATERQSRDVSARRGRAARAVSTGSNGRVEKWGWRWWGGDDGNGSGGGKGGKDGKDGKDDDDKDKDVSPSGF